MLVVFGLWVGLCASWAKLNIVQKHWLCVWACTSFKFHEALAVFCQSVQCLCVPCRVAANDQFRCFSLCHLKNWLNEKCAKMPLFCDFHFLLCTLVLLSLCTAPLCLVIVSWEVPNSSLPFGLRLQ